MPGSEGALYLSANFASSAITLISFLRTSLKSLGHNDNIGVISNITGSCTQMDDSFCLRTLLHHTHKRGTLHHDEPYFLAVFCHIIIDVLCMGLQLIDLLLGDGQSQLFLSLCQCNPQFSPGLEFHILGENVLHLLTGITL